MAEVALLEQGIERGKEWGAEAPLFPLILHYDVCETHENIKRNLRQTLESEYVPFNALLAEPHDREISIVGFGPSLKKTWKQLRGDLMVTNGAHDWLIERGIIPKYAMFFDASDVMTKFVNPHPDVTYLVASRCSRGIFNALKGHKVYVWHGMGDDYLDDFLCEFRKAEPMLGGGTAAVTRGMMVATNMGYRKINLFGADSSFEGKFTHVNESIVPEKIITVWCNGRKFKSTSWLCGQVEDFKILHPLMKKMGCTLEVYGDGLLPHVAKINGYAVHNSTVEETNV